jgi:glycosyl transferase family 25
MIFTIILLFMLFILIILIIYIKPSYKYFQTDIPTYLVSMEKDTERRKHLYMGITPREYSAVDGSKLISKEILQQHGIIKHTDMKNGRIGCYLSHYNILNKIKNYNDEFSLILEDDVFIDIKKKQDIIKDIVLHAPCDWEIIFIGHNYYTEPNPPTHLTYNNYIFKKINEMHGAQSYLVKHSALQTKINTLLPIELPYDIALSKLFNCYILEPQLTKLSEHAQYSNTENIS